MVFLHRWLMICAAFACLTLSGSGACAQGDFEIVEPHPETQRLLVESVQLLRDEQVLTKEEINAEEIYRRYLELRRLASADMPRFVQQAVLAEITHDLDGDLGVYLLLVAVGVDSHMYAAGLSKLLYCDNAALRREAWSLFSERVLGPDHMQESPNLRSIHGLVTGDYQVPEVATPLKRAIFEREPRAALLMFVTTIRPKDRLTHLRKQVTTGGEIEPPEEWVHYRRLERIVDNALYQKRRLDGLPGEKIDEETATALRMLGHDANWWARMYAAETMVQNKEFRDDDLIARLKDDEHELVRGSIASLTTPDPLRAAEVDK